MGQGAAGGEVPGGDVGLGPGAGGAAIQGGDVLGEGVAVVDDFLADVIQVVAPGAGDGPTVAGDLAPAQAVAGAEGEFDGVAVGADGPEAGAGDGGDTGLHELLPGG